MTRTCCILETGQRKKCPIYYLVSYYVILWRLLLVSSLCLVAITFWFESFEEIPLRKHPKLNEIMFDRKIQQVKKT